MKAPEYQIVVPGDKITVETVGRAAVGRARLEPPYMLRLVVFRRAVKLCAWPTYQAEWISEALSGLYLAGVITLPTDATRIDYLTITTLNPPRAHIVVRSLADKYR